MVTRALDQGGEFVRLLEERGAQVKVVPLIRIGPPPNERSLQDAVDKAGNFAWLIFTSAVGVTSFARHLRDPLPPALCIAAIGSATCAAVAEHLGRDVDVMPERFEGGALADAIARRAKPDDSMLIVAAQDAREALPARLRASGFRVTTIAAYTTVEAPPIDLKVQVANCDVIMLASPSAVHALVRGLGGADAPQKLRGKLLACIGPVTELEARNCGLHVEIVPSCATLPAIVDALCTYYTASQS